MHSVSLVSQQTWQRQLQEVPITVLEQVLVTVEYGKHEGCYWEWSLIIGRNWLKLIRLNWHEIKKVSLELDTLLSKYKNLFKEELGTVRAYGASVTRLNRGGLLLR